MMLIFIKSGVNCFYRYTLKDKVAVNFYGTVTGSTGDFFRTSNALKNIGLFVKPVSLILASPYKKSAAECNIFLGI